MALDRLDAEPPRLERDQVRDVARVAEALAEQRQVLAQHLGLEPDALLADLGHRGRRHRDEVGVEQRASPSISNQLAGSSRRRGAYSRSRPPSALIAAIEMLRSLCSRALRATSSSSSMASITLDARARLGARARALDRSRPRAPRMRRDHVGRGEEAEQEAEVRQQRSQAQAHQAEARSRRPARGTRAGASASSSGTAESQRQSSVVTT